VTDALPDLAAMGRALVVIRRPLADIAAEVCERRGNVRPFEIFGRDRTHRVSHARQEVIWHARRLGYSTHMIGRRFPRPENVEGGLDHSTVLYAEVRHEGRLRAQTMQAVRDGDQEAAASYRDYLERRRPEVVGL
jgi:chromosomal replication initiation ATPase DnaA